MTTYIQLTLQECFLQCVATCLHASHTQDGFIDPLDISSNISVDVKYTLLQRASKWKTRLWRKPRLFEILAHRATILRSSPTNKTSENTIFNCQSSSTVALGSICESLISFEEVSYVATAFLVPPGTNGAFIVVFSCICLALSWTEDGHL